MWGTYAALLTQSFDVIAPDARGHGNSGWDGQPFGIDDLADDVAALLEGLGIGSTFIAGMSMGGSTAISFAGRYSSRADGLLLADTTAWCGDDAPATWEARASGVVAKPREEQVAFQADRWFTEGFRDRNAEEVSRVVDIFLRTDSLAHAAACRAGDHGLPRPGAGDHRADTGRGGRGGLRDASRDGPGHRRRGAARIGANPAVAPAPVARQRTRPRRADRRVPQLRGNARVKPPRFAYHAPGTVDEALELLGEYGDESKVLAGGQSLIPVLSFRLSAPEHLIDINRLPGLGEISRLPQALALPALVRQRQAERSAALSESAPLLAEALAGGAPTDPQPRHDLRQPRARRQLRRDACRHAGAERPADDRVGVWHPGRGRGRFLRVSHDDGHFAEELLLAVEFDDAAPRTYTSFLGFAPRKGDFCLAGVAVTVTFGEDGTVAGCRVVAAGVAATPLRLHPVEDLITGSALDADTLAAAQRATHDAVNPSGDVHADAAYRRQLVSVLVRRALSAVNAKKESNDGA